VCWVSSCLSADSRHAKPRSCADCCAARYENVDVPTRSASQLSGLSLEREGRRQASLTDAASQPPHTHYALHETAQQFPSRACCGPVQVRRDTKRSGAGGRSLARQVSVCSDSVTVVVPARDARLSRRVQVHPMSCHSAASVSSARTRPQRQTCRSRAHFVHQGAAWKTAFHSKHGQAASLGYGRCCTGRAA